MPGQDLGTSATVKTYTTAVALTAGQCVIQGATEDACTLAGAANNALFLGFALNDALAGAQTPIQTGGENAKAIAGATCALGDFLMIEGADGRLKPLVLGASNQFVVAKALRAGVDGDLIPVKIVEFVAQGA